MNIRRKKILNYLLLLPLSFPVLAKNPITLCVGAVGDAFVYGDGSNINPYLICNREQLTRLTTEPTLLNKSFIMGADIDLAGLPFAMIGSETTPFQGSFDGNGYTWSSLTLDQSSNPIKNVAPFSYVKNAKISALTINGMTISFGNNTVVGGMIGTAESSTLIDLHVNNLDMVAPDFSGGLVGMLIYSTLYQSSAQGTARQGFGTDGSGGLIGLANGSNVSFCSSDVKLMTTSTAPYGVSEIGGLMGIAYDTHISNVYALGDIDYSLAGSTTGPRRVGGLIGRMGGASFLQNAYYAGKITINAESVGGAVGSVSTPSPFSTGVYWDTELSTVSVSALGEGKVTNTMKRRLFWLNHGFSTRYWLLVNGQYPKFYE